MAITDSNSFTMADLEVMQAALQAQTEKIEAGIDWEHIPAEPDNQQNYIIKEVCQMTANTKLTKQIMEEAILSSGYEIGTIDDQHLDILIYCFMRQYVDESTYLRNKLFCSNEIFENVILSRVVPAEESLYHFHQIMVRVFESAKAKVSFTSYEQEMIINSLVQMHPDLKALPILDHLMNNIGTHFCVTEYRGGKAIGLLFDETETYAEYAEVIPKSWTACNNAQNGSILTVQDALDHWMGTLEASMELNRLKHMFYK